MKRFFAVICAASAAACAALSFSACGSAEVVFTLGEDGSHYVLSEVSGNPSALTSYEIPAVYDDGVHGELPVTEIGRGAFMGCSSLSSVTFPDSIATIENLAFAYTNLMNLDLPESVTYIGYGAFAYSGMLTQVTLPESVVDLGPYAFAYCSKLESVRILGPVTTIYAGTFRGSYRITEADVYTDTSLTEIYLPETVSLMHDTALEGNFLSDIYFAGTAEQWRAVDVFYAEEREGEDGEEAEVVEVLYTEEQKREHFDGLTIHCADATLVYSGGQIEEL